ncbi:fungal-specific transcription factor domain-containing protein [Xylariales sp. PMI_506]|nr:fungal-specific transcription factor domain-containing protein [Xylariales sp. PMI_506]
MAAPTWGPMAPTAADAESTLLCNHCNKVFSRPENLARHQAAYIGDLKFACRCGKRFTRSDLLRRHYKIHDRVNSNRKAAAGRKGGPLGDRLPPSPSSIESSSRSALNGFQDLQSPQNVSQHAPSAFASSWIHHQQEPTSSLFTTFSGANGTSANTALRTASLGIDPTDHGQELFAHAAAFYDANLAWALDYCPDIVLSPDYQPTIPSSARATPSPNNSSSTDVAVGETASTTSITADNSQQVIQPDQETRYAELLPPLQEPKEWPDRVQLPSLDEQRHRGFARSSTAKEALEAERVEFYRPKTGDKKSRLRDTLSEATRVQLLQCISSPEILRYCHHNSQGDSAEALPGLEIAQYFLDLYFVHMHPRYPVIHLPTFRVADASPLLLISMICIGSTFSRVNHGKYGLQYFERTRSALVIERERSINFMRDDSNTFALLLLCSLAIWSGEKFAFDRVESDRSNLVLACKRRRFLDARSTTVTTEHRKSSIQGNKSNGNPDILQAWNDWINVEQRKRLGLCIHLFDCQLTALVNAQPTIAKSEMRNAVLPCADSYWEAPTAYAWKALLGPADVPPSTYYLTTLNSILLHGCVAEALPFPPLDRFCRTLFIYSLHSHIFDWRQILSMVNPYGPVRPVAPFGPQEIGTGLAERGRWLSDSLRNWYTNYGDGGTSQRPPVRNNLPPSSSLNPDVPFRREPQPGVVVASSSSNPCGELLYYLACLATKISLTDLHLVSGRLGSEAEVSLAEESLRNWLQGRGGSDASHRSGGDGGSHESNDAGDVNSVIELAIRMLELAYRTISEGYDVEACSMELAVALFTGGLICWACCRLHDKPAETENMNNDENENSHGSPDSSRRPSNAEFFQHVQLAAKALGSLWQCRLAAYFRSVLRHFCEAAV